jgi:transcriptional regulator with XRE-family HTH domain
MSGIGERIKTARIARGMGRSDFAKALKCSYTATRNWEERGMTPKPHMLVRIAKVLGVTERSLMSPADKPGQGATATLNDFLNRVEKEAATLLGVPAYQVKVTVEIVSK